MHHGQYGFYFFWGFRVEEKRMANTGFDSRNDQLERIVSLLLFVMLIVLLFLGLWPRFYFEGNNIEWLEDEQSIRFTPPAMAYVDALNAGSSGVVGEFSMHLAVSVGRMEKHGFRPMLTMHDGSDQDQLAIWHWDRSLIVMNGDDYDFRKGWPRLSIDKVLREDEQVFISIVSDETGTRIFIDGELVGYNASVTLKVPATGERLRLVLGNSVYGKHGWYGTFHVLACYSYAFSIETVEEHFQHWRVKGDLGDIEKESMMFGYTFSDVSGSTIDDTSSWNNDLVLPPHLVPLKREVYTKPSNDIHSASFWRDVLLNLVGFIPFGFCLRWQLQLRRPQAVLSSVLIAASCCVGLSLLIETAQIWLPGRNSSLLDLILNSFGALMGIGLFELAKRVRRPTQLF